jgi:hypothetical protein
MLRRDLLRACCSSLALPASSFLLPDNLLRAGSQGAQTPLSPASREKPDAAGLEFIDTGIENASPLWYDITDGVIRIHLLYDHERASPNRAAGHIHFRLHAKPGSTLTLEFTNLDNVWNGQAASVANELKTVALSEDGRDWRTVPTQALPANRVQLRVTMQGPTVYLARMQPYRLSDLERFVASLGGNRLVDIATVGRTVGGRDLEIIRIGSPDAPYRVFVRARAHPWEAGSNWVAQGLMRRLLQDDADARRFRQVYGLYVMPMANKDGVARGGTRFNLAGRDLNRNWDVPASRELVPENAALEAWLERMIAAGRQPHLAVELHNDAGGRLHISRPPVPQLDRHLARMTIFDEILRRKTWFTEGSTNAAFRNSGTLGEGWLQRYGIDALVHELNCNWIEGLKSYTSAGHWITYGEQLADVFHDYLVRVTP